MAGGGRRVSRTIRGAQAQAAAISEFQAQAQANANSGMHYNSGGMASNSTSSRYSDLSDPLSALPGLGTPPAPKHMPFPVTPTSDDYIFEFWTFVFVVYAAGLQFLHMYRSVWWLPNSYTDTAMNFYLIDIYLVYFIFIFSSRRIVYLIGCKIMDTVILEQNQTLARLCYRIFLFIILFVSLTWCAYQIIQQHPLVNIFYLCYPLTIYLILFGFTLEPFFDPVDWTSHFPHPIHACCSNPHEIRSEVENLKQNFNKRIKQILFSSIINAYYSGFIPCCFAQSYLYYDVSWAIQHVSFIFISSFTSYAVQYLPLKYCDILHRSSLHLGFWEKIETRSMPPAVYAWDENKLWPLGAVVRQGRNIYRAQGDTNCGEPGNIKYYRFYKMFKNPSFPYGILVIMQAILAVYQLVTLLTRAEYWYNSISVTLMGFHTGLTFYRVWRDYLISSKIYGFEETLREKEKKNMQ